MCSQQEHLLKLSGWAGKPETQSQEHSKRQVLMVGQLGEGLPTLFYRDHHAEASPHVWEDLHSSLRGAISEALVDLSHETGDAAGDTPQNHPSIK